jgi:Mce-associated membrane protein
MTVVEEADTDVVVRDPEPPRRGPVRLLTIAVAVLAVVAVLLGILWAATLNDGSRELAQARDVVLVDARQAAMNLNSLDFENVDAGLDLWEQSSTAGLLEEFRANRAEYAQLVVESQRVTEATVPDAAVAELDLRAGIARVLVGVDVQVTAPGQEPTLFRQRLQMEMTRTADGWKASRADIVR